MSRKRSQVFHHLYPDSRAPLDFPIRWDDSRRAWAFGPELKRGPIWLMFPPTRKETR